MRAYQVGIASAGCPDRRSPVDSIHGFAPGPSFRTRDRTRGVSGKGGERTMSDWCSDVCSSDLSHQFAPDGSVGILARCDPGQVSIFARWRMEHLDGIEAKLLAQPGKGFEENEGIPGWNIVGLVTCAAFALSINPRLRAGA